MISSNTALFFFIALIAAALWGDFALIFFSAFSVVYHINIGIVFLAAYIGTMIGDSLWYAIGRYLGPQIEKKEWLKRGYVRIAEVMEIVFKRRYLLALTVVKYLYGTRVITIIYLAKEHIGFKKFLKYDLLSSIFWIAGVGAVGVLAGMGFVWIETTFKNMQLAVTVLIIFFAAVKLIQQNINAKIEKIRKSEIKNKKGNKNL